MKEIDTFEDILEKLRKTERILWDLGLGRKDIQPTLGMALDHIFDAREGIKKQINHVKKLEQAIERAGRVEKALSLADSWKKIGDKITEEILNWNFHVPPSDLRKRYHRETLCRCERELRRILEE